MEIPKKIERLLPFGDVIVVVDVESSLHVLDVEEGEELVQMDSPGQFDFSAITHPATYLNKVLLGSKQGKLHFSGVTVSDLMLCFFQFSFSVHQTGHTAYV